ncbi:MAG: 6-phosphogluconolactonase [Clostridia bacterium]|jgi:6-phosphogluconolactonase/glucosamine-6-phosphate isomerase/deaminase|nr:6-phosphogluconolactonase [Clostridia bacterium]
MELILSKRPRENEPYLQLAVAENYGALCESASDMIAGCIIKGIVDNGRFVLGLCTGTPAPGVYRSLAMKDGIDWSCVHIFLLEEVLAGDMRGACLETLRNNFLRYVPIPGDNIHTPDSEGFTAAPQRFSAEYERSITDSGGLDLAVVTQSEKFGVSYVNRDTGFSDHCGVVGETDSGFIAAVPGIMTIARARKTVLLSAGKNRALGLKLFMTGTEDPARPVTLLRYCPDITVFAGHEAASLLRRL